MSILENTRLTSVNVYTTVYFMPTTNLAAEMESMDIMSWYNAWKDRAEQNAVTRMRFAGLRFVVYLRRASAKRDAMRKTRSYGTVAA